VRKGRGPTEALFEEGDVNVVREGEEVNRGGDEKKEENILKMGEDEKTRKYTSEGDSESIKANLADGLLCDIVIASDGSSPTPSIVVDVSGQGQTRAYVDEYVGNPSFSQLKSASSTGIEAKMPSSTDRTGEDDGKSKTCGDGHNKGFPELKRIDDYVTCALDALKAPIRHSGWILPFIRSPRIGGYLLHRLRCSSSNAGNTQAIASIGFATVLSGDSGG